MVNGEKPFATLLHSVYSFQKTLIGNCRYRK